ncbi:MAG TPA: STAS domain-containing protein [Nitrospinota bacterium]|jgi:anti-anti-sigma factor|nr:STAS domain-containing protein [Nitrospinota bacterium]|tara:strand:+ start:7924 stop:8280 length:357 start_codon:yes stop_codon:yes gene_type:complete
MKLSKFVTDDEVTILRISGKVISNYLDQLKSGLDSEIDEVARKAHLIINLKNIKVIDSISVGLFISRSRSVKKRGGKMLFCEPQLATRELFAMVDTENWLEVHSTEEQALITMRNGED